MKFFKFTDSSTKDSKIFSETDVLKWWDEKFEKMSPDIQKRFDIEFPEGYPREAKIRTFVGETWAIEVNRDGKFDVDAALSGKF